MLKTSAFAFILVASFVEISGGQAMTHVPAGPEITASGRGEIKVTPTSSLVSISVVTRAPTAAQAAADNATRLESTLRALRALGLAPNDLTTMGYSVGQNYEMTREGPRTPAGFIARNTVRAEVRQLDNIGKVIDAALAGGATEIAGVHYTSANSQEARRSALAAAVREARADAEAIARAAGGSLGTLIALSSGGTPQFREMPYDSDFQMAAAGRVTNIMPRDLTVAAQIVGRWQFVAGQGR